MPGACRLGDMSEGHGCFPARANDEASTNVFINGIGSHRQDDHWETHCCGQICHDGNLSEGSPTVFVNGKQKGRIGDPMSCGDTVATGSSNVFVGP